MIEIRNLSFSYARAHEAALSGVDLTISAGSLFGLLGPNGAGKTTLLSLLCGLLPGQAGEVLIFGEDINASRRKAQSGIGLVPQDFAFYPTLSVAENLEFFGRMQNIAPGDVADRIAETSAITGLTDRLSARAETLSGGLKRRLNLAIGLLNQPNVLLLDEPTVGIDPHSRHFILEAIRQINKRGTTIVYTSHYMEEVEALCDQIAIIDGGKVLVNGSLDSLLRAQQGTHLVIDLDSELSDQQCRSLSDHFEMDINGQSIEVAVNGAEEIAAVLTALELYQLEIVRAQYGARNLEELFLNLTHRSLRD